VFLGGRYEYNSIAKTGFLPHDRRGKGANPMRPAVNLMRQLWRDQSGQDMIEYSLLAAALVVIVAGFLPPSLLPSITTIFSRISSNLSAS
jgi:Flp pilus assembly pilin Flp